MISYFVTGKTSHLSSPTIIHVSTVYIAALNLPLIASRDCSLSIQIQQRNSSYYNIRLTYSSKFYETYFNDRLVCIINALSHNSLLARCLNFFLMLKRTLHLYIIDTLREYLRKFSPVAHLYNYLLLRGLHNLYNDAYNTLIARNTTSFCRSAADDVSRQT